MKKFSVILPVRNGMPYVKECVQSVLSQNFTDFNFLILDNDSDDGTREWLSGIKDPRVYLFTSDVFLSIEESWGRIKTIQKNEYMTVIGHDDILYPDFLKDMNQLILSDPSAALFFSHGVFINKDGRKIRKLRRIGFRENPFDYLHSRLNFSRDVSGTGYVLRSRDYDSHDGIPAFPGLAFADDALWLSVLKDGYIATTFNLNYAIRVREDSESGTNPKTWRNLIEALSMFHTFLDGYVSSREELRVLFDNFSGTFFNRYLINIEIYAYLEAYFDGKTISSNDLVTIDRVKRNVLRTSKYKKNLALSIIETCNNRLGILFIPKLWKIFIRLRALREMVWRAK